MNYFSFLNIQGLKPKTVPSKVPYVRDLLKENNQLFIGLSETWLKDHKEAELLFDNYKIFRSDRVRKKSSVRGRDSGGVAFYVRNDLAQSMEKVLEFSNGVVEALCLYSKEENLFLCVVYRQPDNTFHGHPSLNTQFKEMLNEVQKCIMQVGEKFSDIIIGGDFNLPRIHWHDGSSLPLSLCPKSVREMNATLESFSSHLFLKQVVNKPTHKDGNTLDLVLTNNTDLISDIEFNDTLLSITHHKVVHLSTSYNVNLVDADAINAFYLNEFQKFNFFSEKVDWEGLSSKLGKCNWVALFRNKSVDDMLDIFYTMCLEASEEFVPKRQFSNAKKKQINPAIKKLIRRRRRLNKTLSKVRSDNRKNLLREELLGIEKKLMNLYRSTEEYQENKAISSIKKNSKYFFKYAKKFAKVRSQIGPLKDKNGSFISDPRDIAEALSSQFASVFSKPMNSPNFNTEAVEILLSDIVFNKTDIISCIDELRANAAPGIDGFPAILLKKCKLQLSDPLVYIWNESFKCGKIPSSLKQAIIAPLHKGGSKSSGKQYRPVALTSHIIKIFEKIVKQNVVKYLNDKNLFNPGQHGFRKGRSCLSQLLLHFEELINAVGKHNNVDVVYLDFSKAFDKVDHKILLSKIKRLGIGGKLLVWIEDFLTNRQQSVSVNGFLSSFVEVISGVPQGSVLGPLLFIIMMNDIDKDVDNAVIKSFADDTRAMLSVKNLTDKEKLQADLDIIYSWAENSNLQYNDTKFELIQYGEDKDLHQLYQYQTCSNAPITPSNSVKDLGVLMSSDLSFKCHIDGVVDEAKKRAAWVLRTLKTRDWYSMLTLWKSMVLPKLEYCSQLWCPIKKGDVLRIEEVQRSFVRKICFNDFDDQGYWQRLSRLGLYSLQRRRERYRIIYIWKVLENIVPNISCDGGSGIQPKWNQRLGRFCFVPAINALQNSKVKTIHQGTVSVHGSKLFNALPKHIRDISGCSVEHFKSELDTFIRHIPDEPLIPGYVNSSLTYGSNSLIDIIPKLS